MIVEQERLKAEENLRLVKESERERAQAELEERRKELLEEHLRNQAILEAEKDKVYASFSLFMPC